MPKKVEFNLIEASKSIEMIGVYNTAKKLGIASVTLRERLKANGISYISKYLKPKFNIDFFETIDTESKAYWLGFLYADGCVYINGNYHSTIIGIHKKDIKHIEKFKKEINSNKNIYMTKNLAEIRLESRKMCEDLIKLGCVPAKSLILKFPTEEQVPNYLLRHFIRGYFDGDGSIHWANNQWKIKFTSSLSFCNSLQNKLQELIGSGITKIDYIEGNQWGSVRFNKKNSVKDVLEYMYKNCNLYLDRKYKLYQKYLVGGV